MKTLADHIMDIAQNSTRANATSLRIVVDEDRLLDRLTIQFIDNGCGMDSETVAKVSDPFFTSRTTRKVGMGIPLLKQNAEFTGGVVLISSQVGVGTQLVASFGLSHIDRPPWGDLAGSIALLVSGHPLVEFEFQYSINGKNYLFNTKEIKEELDGVPINTPQVVMFLKQMLFENLIEIGVEF